MRTLCLLNSLVRSRVLGIRVGHSKLHVLMVMLNQFNYFWLRGYRRRIFCRSPLFGDNPVLAGCKIGNAEVPVLVGVSALGEDAIVRCLGIGLGSDLSPGDGAYPSQ